LVGIPPPALTTEKKAHLYQSGQREFGCCSAWKMIVNDERENESKTEEVGIQTAAPMPCLFFNQSVKIRTSFG